MTACDEATKIEISSPRQLRDWLSRNHSQEESVWLETHKKSAGARYVSSSEVLDELVAFGWTDGIRQKVDDQRTMQLISPRRTRFWAKSYKDRAERLITEGRMHPADQESADEAKATGARDEMDSVDALMIPDDLKAALVSNGTALENFVAFPRSTRRNIFRWIASARTAPTRQRRIDQISANAERNVRTKVNG